jgi:hypothetical protein
METNDGTAVVDHEQLGGLAVTVTSNVPLPLESGGVGPLRPINTRVAQLHRRVVERRLRVAGEANLERQRLHRQRLHTRAPASPAAV